MSSGSAMVSISFWIGMVTGCQDATSEEPTPVPLPVVVDDAGVTACTTAEGWTVELDRARVAVADLEFTIAGETHAAWWPRLADLLIRPAHAHPGHYAGGEVTGELAGSFLLELTPPAGAALGDASLLPGEYQGLNLRHRRADAGDGLDATDPLVGHTAVLAGRATREGRTVRFAASLDVPAGTQTVGGPFTLEVTAQTRRTLGLTLYTVDPSEQDTLFDGLDFAALDEDGDGEVTIQPGEAAHNVLMKTLIRHDHWGIVVR